MDGEKAGWCPPAGVFRHTQMKNVVAEQSLDMATNLRPDHRRRIKHSLGAAESYAHRKPRKHDAEMALVRRGMALAAGVRTVLDAPCGVGRASILLARMGYTVTGIDLGEGAVEVARRLVAEAGVAVRIDQEDLVALSFADCAFDAVLCFRLMHHLPTEAHREEIIRQLCRVARRHVLVSYLSPWSFTSVRRLLWRKLGLKTGRTVQYITSRADIERHFRQHGFSLVRDLAQAPLLHSLHLGVFVRDPV